MLGQELSYTLKDVKDYLCNLPDLSPCFCYCFCPEAWACKKLLDLHILSAYQQIFFEISSCWRNTKTFGETLRWAKFFFFFLSTWYFNCERGRYYYLHVQVALITSGCFCMAFVLCHWGHCIYVTMTFMLFPLFTIWCYTCLVCCGIFYTLLTCFDNPPAMWQNINSCSFFYWLLGSDITNTCLNVLGIYQQHESYETIIHHLFICG